MDIVWKFCIPVPASIPAKGAQNLSIANKHQKQKNTLDSGHNKILVSISGRSNHRKKSGQVGKDPEPAGFLLAVLKRQCCGEDVPRPVETYGNAVKLVSEINVLER